MSPETFPDHYIKIHDHGFVGLVDHMGSDAAIVEAARVSYQTGTKATRTDRALIRYLMRHKHTSPLEMCEVKLHIRAPIFVLRQWIRHRTASVNEESGRYSEIREMFFSPALGDLAPQSLDNKQGRQGEFPLHKQKAIRNVIEANNEYSYASYKALLGEDLARELARITLPLTAYSSLYWKIDLHNLLHFLTLRTDSHAQKEIRDYADAILDIIRPLFPYAVEAWEDYQQQAKMLSRMDLDLLAALIRRSNIKTQWIDMVEEARGEKVLAEKFGMSGRELRDFVLLFDLPDF
jgi:thymidylate synthase (FAD)